MNGRWGELPFVALTFCLAAGMCMSLPIRQYVFGALVFGALALIAASWLALKRDQPRRALVLGLSAIVLNGFMLALARRDAFRSTDLRARLGHNEIALDDLMPFDGCVAEDGRKQDGEWVTTVDLRAVSRRGSWLPCRGKVILRVPEDSGVGLGAATVSLEEGNRIRGWASWQLPRNYQNPGAGDHAGFLRRRGVFLQGRVRSARLLETISGDCLDPWRAATVVARRSVQRNLLRLASSGKGDEAAILAAVVVGDYSALCAPVREAFQNSGTYHVLVVSGLHVAWIAWILIMLFRLLRLPQGAGRVGAALLILFYTGVVGFQASISRSLWTFLLCLLGQVIFRRAPPANIALATAFLLLSVRPDWISDAGFQLSFLSVLAICLMGGPITEGVLKPLLDPLCHSGYREWIYLRPGRVHQVGRKLRTVCELLAETAGDRWHPLWERLLLAVSRRAAQVCAVLAGMIVVSVSVQLWLEPLLAYYFNRLSWIAPAANLLIVPLSSLVLAAGLLSALVPQIPLAAPALLKLSGWLSMLLLGTATRISGMPGAWQRCPTPASVYVLGGIFLVFAWCFMDWRRRWIPWAYVAAVLVCLGRGFNPMDFAAKTWGANCGRDAGMACHDMLRITFLDVGEGDSIVIRFPGSTVMVIDAGGVRQGRGGGKCDQVFDVGEAVVSRYLWAQWITRIDRLLLSHPDVDHGGGIPAILKNFRTARLEHGAGAADPLLERISVVAINRGVAQAARRTGQKEVVGGVGIEVLNPPGDGMSRTSNEDSVVVRLTYGRFSALLTGDLERAAERAITERHTGLRSCLLKVAHHGSRWATQQTLLESVRPRWAVISVGRNNPFGHPSPEVVARLLRHGVLPLLTTDRGAVTFATDGFRYVLDSYVGGILESGLLP